MQELITPLTVCQCVSATVCPRLRNYYVNVNGQKKNLTFIPDLSCIIVNRLFTDQHDEYRVCVRCSGSEMFVFFPLFHTFAQCCHSNICIFSFWFLCVEQNSQPKLEVFQDLLNKHPNVFYPSRTAKSLLVHWQLLKQYYLLDDQSGKHALNSCALKNKTSFKPLTHSTYLHHFFFSPSSASA